MRIQTPLFYLFYYFFFFLQGSTGEEAGKTFTFIPDSCAASLTSKLSQFSKRSFDNKNFCLTSSKHAEIQPPVKQQNRTIAFPVRTGRKQYFGLGLWIASFRGF